MSTGSRVLVWAALLLALPTDLAAQCRTDAHCGAGRICRDGRCAVAPSA